MVVLAIVPILCFIVTLRDVQCINVRQFKMKTVTFRIIFQVIVESYIVNVWLLFCRMFHNSSLVMCSCVMKDEKGDLYSLPFVTAVPLYSNWTNDLAIAKISSTSQHQLLTQPFKIHKIINRTINFLNQFNAEILIRIQNQNTLLPVLPVPYKILVMKNRSIWTPSYVKETTTCQRQI